MSASVTILYFAWLRERIGAPRETFALPDGVASIGALIDTLAARGGGHAAAFANRQAIRCAVNQAVGGPDTQVSPGDEIAFFPPVTGG